MSWPKTSKGSLLPCTGADGAEGWGPLWGRGAAAIGGKGPAGSLGGGGIPCDKHNNNNNAYNCSNNTCDDDKAVHFPARMMIQQELCMYKLQGSFVMPLSGLR